MSNRSRPLQDLCIWLTRPQFQSAELETALRQLGARTLCFPLLEITPLEPQGDTRRHLLDLDQYDLIFYVSSNAARIGLQYISDWWPQYPAQLLNFAVGPATASVIKEYGLDVHYPIDRMDSEAMLALPELQSIEGKKALIVRGRGGREILAEGLSARGARVDYAELYLRSCPAHSREHMRDCLERCPPGVIVISSAEAMDNLVALFSPWYESWKELPLHVASERLAQHAGAAGFNTAITMAGASDDAIITGLITSRGGQDS